MPTTRMGEVAGIYDAIEPRWLLDTNVVIAAINDRNNHHRASAALIARRGDLAMSIHLAREALVVMTRPVHGNGLGLNTLDAWRTLDAITASISLLDDSVSTWPTFKDCFLRWQPQGKRLHDAAHAATAIAHGLAGLVTWNITDFTGWSNDLLVMTPDQMLAQ